MKIGVFDSGVGGISVLKELKKSLPAHEFIYFGDNANVPYGGKSPAQIERLCLTAAEKLKELGIDALVVACNTASSWALGALKEALHPVPVYGVVEPGIQAAQAAAAQARGPILVLATRATIQSGAYGRGLREVFSGEVIEQACPLLAPMIEEGWIDHPILHATIAEYVTPHIRGKPPGVALLGCTHYPWIQAAFERALPGWAVVNSAQAVAHTVVTRYGGHASITQNAPTTWIFTDPPAVPAFADRWIRA